MEMLHGQRGILTQYMARRSCSNFLLVIIQNSMQFYSYIACFTLTNRGGTVKFGLSGLAVMCITTLDPNCMA